MKFSELNKEQKQYVVLGVMMVVTAVAVIQNLLLAPRRERLAAAQKMITDNEARVRRGEATLRRDRVTRESLRETAAAIVKISEELPPELSRYTWALNRVMGVAHDLELPPPLVREYSGQRFVAHRRPYAEVRDRASMWVPYTLEVTAQLGYHDLLRFLAKLKEDHPYISVGSLSIQENVATPERHNIRMLLEWPVFRHGRDREVVRELAGGDA